MNMTPHINDTCKNILLSIKSSGRIRKYVSQESLKKLVHALVLSHSDYASSLLFITLIIICETEIREINTSLAIQCMQACTQGCYKTINTDFKRNNTPFVLNISQRSSEGRISLFGF